jgi:hypothetical protein
MNNSSNVTSNSSYANLSHLLTLAATSPDAATRAAAGHSIKQWEASSVQDQESQSQGPPHAPPVDNNIYIIATHVLLNEAVAPETRVLAAVLLRNGIDRHWRKTARTCVSKKEKKRKKATL